MKPRRPARQRAIADQEAAHLGFWGGVRLVSTTCLGAVLAIGLWLIVAILFVLTLGAGIIAVIFHDNVASVLDWGIGYSREPSPELAQILSELQPPYLCGGEAKESCNMDPINLLFINVEEGAETTRIAVFVRNELLELDKNWGTSAIHPSVMYFSIDGRRYIRQAELKEYQASAFPDAWHVRFRASPGCEIGSDGACYVVAATHYDDFNSNRCPFNADVGISFISARQLVERTFAKKYETAYVRYPNDQIPSQPRCPGTSDREQNGIVVVNMRQTTETRWPPLDFGWALTAIPRGDLPPDGSLITSRVGMTTYPIYIIGAGKARRISDELFLSCAFDHKAVITLPLGQLLIIPEGPDLIACPP